MPIRTQCPHCQTSYTVPDAQLGKHVRCRSCAETFVVSAEPELAPPPEAEAVHNEPVRRPLPARRRRPAQEEQKESSGAGVAIALVVVLGTLLVLGGAATFAYYFFIRVEEPKPELAGKGPVLMPPEFDEGPDPEERLTFVPTNFDQPDAGPRTFFPEAPIAPLAAPDAPPAAAGDSQLPEEVLKRVKAATALLQVTMADGTMGEGTGFFAVEPGLLVTNAHVVGMIQPKSEKPKRVDIILNSGYSDERTLSGQIIGVDRRADLAVLSVRDAQLPEPLKVDTSKNLRETQPVYVLGFPGGSGRSRNISVTQTTVDSLHTEENVLERVQVRTAMLPGNSGGPVVDQRGNVVAVSVAIYIMAAVGNTGINYAVPSDKVHHLLEGRVLELAVDYPQQAGDGVKLPVRMKLFDERSQVKTAGLEWWIGDAGPDRLPALKPPEALAGDQGRTRVTLRRTPKGLEQELVLPPLPGGKTYWLQPVLMGKDADKPRWSTAVSYTPPPLLQMRPVTFAKKEDKTTQPLDATSRSSFTLRTQQGQTPLFNLNLHAKLEESAGGTEAVRKITGFDVGLRVVGQAAKRGELRRLMFRRYAGGLPRPQGDFNHLPEKHRREVQLFSETIQDFITALDIPLPTTELKPEQTWTESRSLSLEHLIDRHAGQTYEIKYAYLGVRTRDGREEAIVHLDGKPTGGTEAPRGLLRGTAWIDVATGKTTLVRASVEYEIMDHEVLEGGSVSGKTEFRLHRPGS